MESMSITIGNHRAGTAIALAAVVMLALPADAQISVGGRPLPQPAAIAATPPATHSGPVPSAMVQVPPAAAEVAGGGRPPAHPSAPPPPPPRHSFRTGAFRHGAGAAGRACDAGAAMERRGWRLGPSVDDGCRRPRRRGEFRCLRGGD